VSTSLFRRDPSFVVALPQHRQHAARRIVGISWAIIAYQLAGISLSIVLGRLGDIHGRYAIYGTGFAGHRAYLEGKAAEVIEPRKVLGLMGGEEYYEVERENTSTLGSSSRGTRENTPYVQETLRPRDCFIPFDPRGLCVGREVD